MTKEQHDALKAGIKAFTGKRGENIKLAEQLSKTPQFRNITLHSIESMISKVKGYGNLDVYEEPTMQTPDEALIEPSKHFEKQEVNKAKKQIKDLLEENAQMQSELDNIRHINGHNPVYMKYESKPGKSSVSTAFVVISDQHIEKTIEKAVTNGYNEYSLDIAYQGHRNVVHNSLKLIRKNSNRAIERLVINFGGGGIEGHIHEEYLINNSLTPLQAVDVLADWYYSMLMDYKKGFNGEIIVLSEFGNHSRLSKKPMYNIGYKMSLEWHLHERLKREFKNDSQIIEWRNPESASNTIEIYGVKICFEHGDQFKYAGGVGGLWIAANRYIGKRHRDEAADYYVFGHYHQYNPRGGRIMTNGSMCGYDGYAQGKGLEREIPVQMYFEINSEIGLTEYKPIIVRTAM